jgi:hypothetical protein
MPPAVAGPEATPEAPGGFHPEFQTITGAE